MVTADLESVRRFAHAHGGTINDAVLTAITGASRTLLLTRGEDITTLVVSIPVSARTAAETSRLGNQVGVMPVTLPTDGTPGDRLERTATITRARKSRAPGSSAELVAAVNRILARLGLLNRILDHQRMINTVVTNLRGPGHPLTLDGIPVQTIVPITPARGNVTTVFNVLSYAGTLTIAITADTHQVPDLPALSTALDQELTAMTHPDPD